MEELTTFELLSINGGSQRSYENGRAAGAKTREFLDDFQDAYFWASLAFLLVFKVTV